MPRAPAGVAGRAIFAAAVVITRSLAGPIPSATSFVSGWSFVWAHTVRSRRRGPPGSAAWLRRWCMADGIKFLPRNATATRLVRPVAGNPVTTRLEDGVGNCYPGLECDLRNLERRFFPGLEMDIAQGSLTVSSVDLKLAPQPLRNALRSVARDVGRGRAWAVKTITSTFGPLGTLTLAIKDLRLNRSNQPRSASRPPDVWTALRLIPEGSDVELVLVSRTAKDRRPPVTISGARAAYLDDNGALAAMFHPGEMTQSLCSPWTHDFRDCACFYWASNHPDIVLPARPESATDLASNVRVPWERAARALTPAPSSASSRRSEDEAREMRYFEINMRWQE